MFDCSKVSRLLMLMSKNPQISNIKSPEAKRQFSHLPAQRSDNRRQSVRWCNLRSLTSPVALYLSRVESNQSQVRQACFGILCFRFVHFCTYLSFYATFRRYLHAEIKFSNTTELLSLSRRCGGHPKGRERPPCRRHKLKTTREFPAKLSRIWPDLESVPTVLSYGDVTQESVLLEFIDLSGRLYALGFKP